jgi:hypothetical protein
VTRLLRGFLGVVALALAALLAFELAWPPYYDFAPPEPFHGAQWYNPYAGYTGGGLLANFHAHSEAWGGLTFGDTPRSELYALYKARGYDVIGISDYMSLDAPIESGQLFVSSYEHGFTPGRHHHTVIGANHVVWLDYPFGGSTRQKQNVLDWLRPGAQLLVINHPTKANSFTIHDLEWLSGYDAVEVATKYGVWDDYWDAALSAGRPVWGMAADDGHAQTEQGSGSHLGIGALVIHTAERTPEAVLAALRAGRFHSLYTRQNEPPLLLERCEFDGGALHVRVGETANAIRFYGAHGVLRYQELGRAEASYKPRADDPYVRVEVIAHGAVVYLNPVLRWDGVALPRPEARVRWVPTWFARGAGLAALLAFGALLVRLLRPRSQRAGESVGSGIRNNT